MGEIRLSTILRQMNINVHDVMQEELIAEAERLEQIESASRSDGLSELQSAWQSATEDARLQFTDWANAN